MNDDVAYFWLSLRSQMEQAKWSTHHAFFNAVNTDIHTHTSGFSTIFTPKNLDKQIPETTATRHKSTTRQKSYSEKHKTTVHYTTLRQLTLTIK